MNNNEEKVLKNENVREKIEEIKKLNPNLEDNILKTKDFLLKDINKEDKKSGAWFQIIVKKVFETHAKNVNYEYFREKYNTSVKDIIAKKLIDSASNYSVMVGAVLGAAGGVFGVPTAIPATFGEIVTLTYFQLNMIYDLSLIYDKPIDLDDPEEAYKILLLALGIKASELLNGGIEIAIKKGGVFAIEKAGKQVVLRPIQNLLKEVGVQITQRAIKNWLAKAIPLVGIFTGGIICAALDYKSTRYVAYNSLSIYRTSQLIIELFDNNNSIPVDDNKSFDILIKGCMIIANSDNIVDLHKTILIEHIYKKTSLTNNYKERIKILDKEFLEPYERIDDLEIKKTIFFALEIVSASDGKISKNERKLLESMSSHLGKDKKTLDQELKDLIESLFII